MSWSGVKRTAIAAFVVLFTTIGGGMVIFGSGGDRLVGLGIGLMFGGGGLAWWRMHRPRDRPLPGFQVGAVSDAGGRAVAFVARSDKKVLIASVVGCLAMGGGSLLAGLAPDNAGRFDDGEVATFIFGGLLFIGVGLFGLARVANNSHFALTARGFHAIGPAGWFVPWNAMTGIDEIAVHGTPFLGIRVRDPSAIEMGRIQRIGHGLQRSMMDVDLSVPIRTLTVDPAELVAAIARYREHPELRSRIGLADELAVISAPTRSEAAVAPRAGTKGRPSILRILAIASLLLVGGLFAIVTVGKAVDDVAPGRGLTRLVTVLVYGGLALGQLAAAVFVIRHVRIGRWIGIASTLGIIGLILYALALGEDRFVGLVLLALLGAHLLIVAVGGRVASTPTRPSRPDAAAHRS